MSTLSDAKRRVLQNCMRLAASQVIKLTNQCQRDDERWLEMRKRSAEAERPQTHFDRAEKLSGYTTTLAESWASFPECRNEPLPPPVEILKICDRMEKEERERFTPIEGVPAMFKKWEQQQQVKAGK